VAKSDTAPRWQFKTSPDTGPHTFGVAVSSGTKARLQPYSTTVRSLIVGAMWPVFTMRRPELWTFTQHSQINSSVNVNIGRRTGGFSFNGVIDEVRIYNRPLNAAEIQADMITPLPSN
jgi:hypothetical protein